MKKLVLSACLLYASQTVNAQLTLENTYNGVNTGIIGNISISYPNEISFAMVNLANSGRKYAAMDANNAEVRLYNLDHSLWKTINLPSVLDYSPIAPSYISENLFKLDNKVDMAIRYSAIIGSTYQSKILIIDEDGLIINTIENINGITVVNAGNNIFKAIAGSSVYSLPGTIPCDICGNGLGLAKTEKTIFPNISTPIPNPSGNQARIDYSLPSDAKNATLNIYNTTGQIVKSYTVDQTFNSLIIDNTTLNSGVYYYNIAVAGSTSTTKKMIVIK